MKLYCPKCDKETATKETQFQFAGLGWPIYVCVVCGHKHDAFVQGVERGSKSGRSNARTE